MRSGMRLAARQTFRANFRAYQADLDPFQTHVALSLASRAHSVLRSAIGRRACTFMQGRRTWRRRCRKVAHSSAPRFESAPARSLIRSPSNSIPGGGVECNAAGRPSS
jgi:hypothetical protein